MHVVLIRGVDVFFRLSRLFFRSFKTLCLLNYALMKRHDYDITEHLEKVAKHQRYLAGETGSDPDSLALKPAKATKKSKPSVPKADLRPPVTKLASSQQLEPKPAPAKSQGKKRKLVTKISDKPSPARKSRPGFVTKRRKPTSSLRSIDEYVAEGIPEKEPRFANEEANVQMALEESLKKVQGKGKEKVTDEQVALDLLTLQVPKKKSPTDQFIFQRHTSIPTGSSGHDESSSLYAKLGLTDSEVESDKDVPGMDAGVEDEGQARPNPHEKDKGHARPNPGDAASYQPQSSPVVLAGPNLEHTDLKVTNVSTQPHPEKIDEGFTATVYPKVHENLKLMVKEHVILEEPASSTGTLSSLQHLVKDLSFGDIFFNDKPSEADNEKTTAETEAESMRIGELEHIMANLIQDNKHLEERLDSHGKKKRRDSPKTPPGSPPHQPPPLPPPAGPSRTSGSPRASGSSQVSPPPPPPLSTNQEGQSHGSAVTSSSKTATSAEYKAWTMTDTRLWSSVSSTPADLQMDDDMAPDPLKEARPATLEPAWSIPSSDLPVLKKNWASALTSTYLPPSEDSLLVQTSDMPMFMDWFCKRQGIIKLKPQDLEGTAFELVKVFHPNVIHLQYQMEEFHKLLTDSVDDSSSGIMLANHYYWVVHPVRIKVFSMYGYDYMNKIVLRRADLNEHIIAKRDFKYLYPSDFDDLYRVQMIMRFNEIHKFSDGTLHQIDETLDYRVKEFKVNKMNPGLNTRFWIKKDVHRSKEFMFAIQKWLKTRRIFNNLESFVGGRVRDGDYRLIKRTE
nr:hypothetical protein [Tanacetum cinerariifolium]